MAEARVACRTPAEGKTGVTRIPAWKFDAIRGAILAALQSGPVRFKDLADEVRSRLSGEDLTRLGSLGWHVTTVKLELEVRGEILRDRSEGQQLLRRAG